MEYYFQSDIKNNADDERGELFDFLTGLFFNNELENIHPIDLGIILYDVPKKLNHKENVQLFKRVFF